LSKRNAVKWQLVFVIARKLADFLLLLLRFFFCFLFSFRFLLAL
jgi:hypothetical protein